MADKIRVLVVDDSTFMRSAIVRMIKMDPRFEVLAAATNGKEGIQMAQELKPDVITMDIEMPVMNGIEALKEIMRTTKTPVVMISTLTEAGAKITMEALTIGAVDFIPKALNDKNANIFRGAETIHDKLAAAANSGPERRAKAMAAPVNRLATNAPALPKPTTTRVAAKVVVIGSSTGGPRALQEVISKLPKNLSAPVVIAQHMPPQFTLALAKRLDETCNIHVVEATESQPLQAGTVYIAPGGSHMRIDARGLHIHPDAGESAYKPSVDVLAESARKTFGKNVLAVMLTGMGNDGTKEFVKLKGEGAYVLAQDQASSVVYGMPKAVYEAGGVHEVLALADIGPRIARLVG